MLWADNYLFDCVSLHHIHDITSAFLINYNADLSMIPTMRHAFVNTGFSPNYNFLSRFILIKYFAESNLSPFSRFLLQEGTGFSAIAFRLSSHFQDSLTTTSKTSKSRGLASVLMTLATLGSVRPSSPVINSLM